jgi:hypothetical protein
VFEKYAKIIKAAAKSYKKYETLVKYLDLEALNGPLHA